MRIGQCKSVFSQKCPYFCFLNKRFLALCIPLFSFLPISFYNVYSNKKMCNIKIYRKEREREREGNAGTNLEQFSSSKVIFVIYPKKYGLTDFGGISRTWALTIFVSTFRTRPKSFWTFTLSWNLNLKHGHSLVQKNLTIEGP